ATTLVIRLTVTVLGQGAPPGDGSDDGDDDDGNGGDERGNDRGGGRGPGGEGGGAPATVRVVLRVNGASAPGEVTVAPGQALIVDLRDGADEDHRVVVAASNGMVREVKVPAGGHETVSLNFARPAEYTVQVLDPLHPEESVRILVRVNQQADAGTAVRVLDVRRFLVNWERWWAALRSRLAA
ncbi:MAG TPA: hypothetical protein VIK99_05100, partial [Thermaerobacter sp.]